MQLSFLPSIFHILVKSADGFLFLFILSCVTDSRISGRKIPFTIAVTRSGIRAKNHSAFYSAIFYCS
jgi:hypothetical protein